MRASIRVVLLALLLLLSLSTAALGQDMGLEELIEQAREAGADVDQVQAVAERARKAGLGSEAVTSLLRAPVGLAKQNLPAGPVLSKAMEGLTKGVPAGRIESVLQQQRTYTEWAGQVVNQWSQQAEETRPFEAPENPRSDSQWPYSQNSGEDRGAARNELITATANALRQEVPARDLEAFLNGLPQEAGRSVSAGQVGTAVGVIPDLLDAGASPETARDLLTSAVAAGYQPESLAQMPEALQTARRASERPVEALAKGAARAAARNVPAAAVLQGLFQGGIPGAGPPPGLDISGTTPGMGMLPAPASGRGGAPGDPKPPTGPPGAGGSP